MINSQGGCVLHFGEFQVWDMTPHAIKAPSLIVVNALRAGLLLKKSIQLHGW